jgi:hypothetical protein
VGDSDRNEQGSGDPTASKWQLGGTLVRPAARSGSALQGRRLEAATEQEVATCLGGMVVARRWRW